MVILASKQLVRDGRDEYDGIAPRPLARGALQVAVEIIPPTIEQKRRINKAGRTPARPITFPAGWNFTAPPWEQKR